MILFKRVFIIVILIVINWFTYILSWVNRIDIVSWGWGRGEEEGEGEGEGEEGGEGGMVEINTSNIGGKWDVRLD